ncbi:MAG: hypothetical protein K6G63_08780 [Eubacterium sp.]|nr:hypothetical protein [Eubacterium sp.]
MYNTKINVKKMLSLLVFVAVIFSGCNGVANNEKTAANNETTTSEKVEEPAQTAASNLSETQTEEPIKDIPYKFNPHEYSAKMAESYTEDHWTSFYNLCDALRVGKDTFKCASKKIYEWCMDEVTLSQLFPAACMKVMGKSNDGTTPYKKGIGRIYYNMPKKKFVKRQAKFEKRVTKVINDNVRSSYSDFEKCLFLYKYMESNFKYNHKWPSFGNDGADYYSFMHKKGICCELAAVYAYLLRQVGVDAFEYGCSESMEHAWTYVVVNGKGYHIDPTWALKSELGNDDLYLDYFMMSKKDRTEDNFDLSTATIPLLPEYDVSKSGKKFPAKDKTYSCLRDTYFEDIDTEKNILYYRSASDDKVHELKYED